MKSFVTITLLAVLSVLTVIGTPFTAAADQKIAFGVLPVIQALPLFVAADRGFFAEEGLDVELVPFRSSLEKDAAITAGTIQGYFGDMLTSIILDSNSLPVRMVATVYNTTGDQRMFAVLAAPGTGKPSLAELAQNGIAGASNTIIEYFIEKLLAEENPSAQLKMIEAKSIPSRVPMLLSGKVPGAALPEPLVTLAEKKGAVVVADDRGKGFSPTVLIFTKKFLLDREADAVKFLKATSRASAFIGRNPKTTRAIMIKYTKVPVPLQQTIEIPSFGLPVVPAHGLVMDAYNWLRQKKILKSEMTWGQMVQEGLL